MILNRKISLTVGLHIHKLVVRAQTTRIVFQEIKILAILI